MSLLSAAALLAAGQATDVLLITSGFGSAYQRKIGSGASMIIPQATLQEHSSDLMTITQHPVEYGAVISDHAYKMPETVSMRCAWSNSGSLFNLGLGVSPMDSVYKNLLAMQSARQPINVVTGKRAYQNMLIKSIDVMTDASTENALIIEVMFQQVIMVQTSAATMAPAANQASPQQTAAIVNGGTIQPIPLSTPPPGVGTL